jgi:hypothetical protein
MHDKQKRLNNQHPSHSLGTRKKGRDCDPLMKSRLLAVMYHSKGFNVFTLVF